MPHIGRTIGRAGVRRGIDGHEHGIQDGRAMFTVASVIFPSASTEKAIGRGPARVSATRLPEATSASSRSTRYLAKQRTPLPHIWAKVPSALM